MRFLLVFALLTSVLFAQCPTNRRVERERQRHEHRYRHHSGRHFHRGYRYDPVIHRVVPVRPIRIIYIPLRTTPTRCVPVRVVGTRVVQVCPVRSR